MELSQRLTGARRRPTAVQRDPFADVKDRIHKAVIGGLGPEHLQHRDRPRGASRRVQADIAAQLAGEPGIARSDAERIARERGR